MIQPTQRPTLPPTLVPTLALSLTLSLTFWAPALHAQEAEIRKNIAARLPDYPKIDEVRPSAIPGLYELRFGTDILYTDARGDHIIEGQITATRTRTNLTQERIDKITAIPFAALPLQDAIVWKQGSGARKLVVFADPNCGYCKKFETEMQAVKDVTVYTFLIPILGGDSPEKSRDIWCSKDSASAWRDWMIQGAAPVRNMGACDVGALQRNLAMSRKLHVTGTPMLVFEDGKRVPGALGAEQVSRQLAASRAKPG
jgi:thiol:disulfide interchange protein DsbC